MSLTIVPVIFLTLMVVLVGIEKGVEIKGNQSKKIEQNLRKNKKVLSNQEKKMHKASYKENKKDLNTIYNYITSKFKNVSQDDAKKISQNLVEHGKKYNVDPKFAAAVIARESGFKKDAVSHTGAKGLGQIKDFNFKDLNINDPYNINQNVSGTVQYLKKMIQKLNEQPQHKKVVSKPKDEPDNIKLALASYYKGFTAVTNQGIDHKTNKYVDDIIKYYKEIINSEK